MKERAGRQPSWLTSTHAEHATAKHRLPRCDSALLFYCCLSFPLPDPLCSATSFTSPPSTHYEVCSYVSRTYTCLGCETKRNTPPAISKMAEFNGQTLGRYSSVAMKIKVGGGGGWSLSRFVRFPRRENDEKIARSSCHWGSAAPVQRGKTVPKNLVPWFLLVFEGYFNRRLFGIAGKWTMMVRVKQ